MVVVVVMMECEKEDGKIDFDAMLDWLRGHVGFRHHGKVVPRNVVYDDVLHELHIAGNYDGRAGRDDDVCAVRENAECVDDEEEAVRIGERLVYGWPSRDCEPTGVYSFGRFVKAFPLDFPMGIGDLYEERPRKVTPAEWVQHMLRYKSGHFVGGLRGQRVL